ncbi:MAG: pilus assembly protein [Chloroflexi bacterium]|nr:pilus assembly protein [Chloroflexota bacterium]MBK8932085.1 pilus assembly protein [Chloroflexota bacterium]
MNKKNRCQSTSSKKGQSLVELALVLPILLVLIAGTVEVSNLLITKNRIETAARAAARFASDGGDDVHIIALNSVTQTLDLSEGVWDIFTIHGRINNQGTSFDNTGWEVEHYGLGQTRVYTEVLNRLSAACTTDCLQDEMIAELQGNRNGAQSQILAADLEIVGVYVIHDINSILGLNALPGLADYNSVQGFGVMRRASLSNVNQTNGCTAVFPLAVSNGIRSITEAEYTTAYNNMTYPVPRPLYTSFTQHRPNIDLASATEGTVFLYDLDSLQVVFPKWNAGITSGNTTLSNSLAWPSNISDYTNHNDAGVPIPGLAFVVRGFVEVGDNTDRSIHISDRVAVNGEIGNLNGITGALQNHITNKRTLRLLVLSNTAEQYLNGVPFYQPTGFAIYRISGYSLTNNWILLEFIRWDHSCGQS